MKKLLKLVSLLIGLAIVLSGLTALALKIFLPPEKAKVLVQNQLESRLHRQVELGTVSVGLYSGLSIDNFKVSEKPDFNSGTFISSDRFSIRVNWLALIFKKIIVHSIELKNPTVHLVRLADGKTYNFSDLMTTSPSGAATPNGNPSSASPFSLLIVKALLTDGNLNFIDQSPKQQSAKIEDLNLTLRNIGLTAPLDLKGGCKVQAFHKLFRIDVDATASLKGNTVIKRASLESGVSRVELSGTLADLFSDQPSVDLALQLKNIETSLLGELGALPSGLRVSGLLGGQAAVKGRQDDLTFSTTINFDKVGLEQPGTFVKKEGDPMQLSGKGRLVQLNDLTIDSFSVSLGTFSASGSGSVKPLAGPHPHLVLRVNTNAFYVAAVLPHFPSAKFPADLKLSEPLQLTLEYTGSTDQGSGKFKTNMGKVTLGGTGSFSTSGKNLAYQADIVSENLPLAELSRFVSVAKPYDLKGTADLSAHLSSGKKALVYQATVALKNSSLVYQKSQFTELNAHITASPDSILIPSFTGKLNGAPFKAQIKALGLETTPTITVEANADAVDLSKLLPPDTPENQKGKQVPPPVPAPPSLLAKFNSTGHIAIGKLTHEFFNAQAANLSWNLTSVTLALNQINGTATLRTGPGGLTQAAQTSKSMIGKVLLSPLTIVQKLGKFAGGAINVPSLERIHFQQVTGDYRFVNGILNVDKFNLNGAEARVDLSGTAMLYGAQTLKMKLAVQGPSDSTAAHIKIGGTIPDPKFGIDATEQGKQIFKAIKGGTADPLLKRLGLPGFGSTSTSGDQPATTTPPPADDKTQANPAPTPQENIEDQAKKQLNNLFKGLLNH